MLLETISEKIWKSDQNNPYWILSKDIFGENKKNKLYYVYEEKTWSWVYYV